MKTLINKITAWWFRNVIGMDYYYLKNMNNEYCWWELTSYGALIRIDTDKSK